MQSGQPFPAPQIASRDTVLFFKDHESSFLTLQRHFYFSVWLLTFWLARFWALVDFKLKQYFHCSVISGPIIFCLLIACYSGDSLVMSEHLINSSAYYKLRLSVLKSPFWLVTLLGMVSSSLGKLAAFSLLWHLVQQEQERTRDCSTVNFENFEDFRQGAFWNAD